MVLELDPVVRALLGLWDLIQVHLIELLAVLGAEVDTWNVLEKSAFDLDFNFFDDWNSLSLRDFVGFRWYVSKVGKSLSDLLAELLLGVLLQLRECWRPIKGNEILEGLLDDLAVLAY